MYIYMLIFAVLTCINILFRDCGSKGFTPLRGVCTPKVTPRGEYIHPMLHPKGVVLDWYVVHPSGVYSTPNF